MDAPAPVGVRRMRSTRRRWDLMPTDLLGRTGVMILASSWILAGGPPSSASSRCRTMEPRSIPTSLCVEVAWADDATPDGPDDIGIRSGAGVMLDRDDVPGGWSPSSLNDHLSALPPLAQAPKQGPPATLR
jgi:hypothetical protein